MVRPAEEMPRPEGRVPPHNLEAEESVLGSMMLLEDAVAQVTEILRAQDFYRSAHRVIYEALVGLFARGEPVDAVTAVEELKRRSTLEKAGGALSIHHLVESVPTPASAGHYARIVADNAMLRRLIEAGSEIVRLAYDVPEEPTKLADQAEGLVYQVARHSEKEEVVSLRDLVGHTLETLERMHDREGLSGVATGFTDLDRLLQGLQPSNLIVVAARPGVGKSSLVTNIARNVAIDAEQPVAMFSLEMSRIEIAMRLLCAEAGIGQDKVRAMRVAAEEWPRIVEAAEVLDRAPLYIVDSGAMTIVDIRAKARRLKSGPGLGLLIVDYLQLMSSHHRVESRQQEIAEISRSLKLLAKELDIPVIAVSQLNRNPESRTDKRPQLSDLRECVTGDTPVCLADGRRVPVEELAGTTPEVLSVSTEGRLVVAEAEKVWKVGCRPVFDVRLASGRRLRCTADHRLLSGRGWQRLRDLEPGDRLALARELPEPLNPVEWPDDRVALLGQLIGDGSYLNNAPMRYTSSSEANLRLVSQLARQEFGAQVQRQGRPGTWKQLMLFGKGSRSNPTMIIEWLGALGILGQRTHEKRVPGQAFRLPNRQIALLLRQLWATDGCISVRAGGQRGCHKVFFSTTSRGLADDVASLLLRMGIVARILTVKREGSRPRFHVDVSGDETQRRFAERVGAFGLMRAPVRRLAQALDGGSSTIVDAVRGEGLMRGQDHVAPATTDDLLWDRIVSVTPDGEEDVFDLTVPGPESWLADGVTVHNSGAIEQDSDVVMFIHREDLFSEDADVKGIAEIIVAKHRNGPVDKIRLTFIDKLTQFRNHARG